MAYGEYRELKRYIKVTQENRWVYNKKRTRYGYAAGSDRSYIKTTMVSKLPEEKDRKWNDVYFPITIKVPMFYVNDKDIKVNVPPMHEGDAIAEIFKNED